MKKMTPIYILWGVVMCLQVAFIFRDTTHIVGYTLEFINPNDLQELSIPLVVKPDVYEPDTLVNTRTGEAIKVAYGQAVKHFWHTDSFQTVPWGMRLFGAVCGMLSMLFIVWPYRWSNTFFKNIEQGDFFTTLPVGGRGIAGRVSLHRLSGLADAAGLRALPGGLRVVFLVGLCHLACLLPVCCRSLPHRDKATGGYRRTGIDKV